MFKVGDKIVCVDPAFSGTQKNNTLTNHKVYTVTRGPDYVNLIHIVNDNNSEDRYFSERFMLFTEYRKLKIKKICSKLEI